MGSQVKSSDMKVKKKRWIDIVSPLFRDISIGETNVYDLEGALNKKIKINLMNLTRDPRKQNVDILFETEKLKGETAVIAGVRGYNMHQPALRKMVRRGKTKLQDSFKCYTGDKKPIVIKIFVLTKNNVNNMIARKIREQVKQLTVNKVSKISFDNFILSVIDYKFQMDIKSTVSKIYPVKTLEYNTIKLLTTTNGKFETPKEIVIEKETSDENKIATTEKTKNVSTEKKAPKKVENKEDKKITVENK